MLSWLMHSPKNAQNLVNIKRMELENEISKLKLPVLILGGENDIVGTIEESQFINQSIIGSYVEIIKNAWHYMFLEYLELAFEKMDAFLGGNYSVLHSKIKVSSK